MLRTLRTLVLATLALAAAVPAAHAGSDAPDYQSVVVQNRAYTLRHEIGLQVGVLPMDAFTKGVTLGGSYTLHFNQILAWEVVQFMHSFPFDTSLNDDLASFDLRPTPFETIDNLISTNLVFKPVYFKGSALNRSVIAGELFVVLGGAYAWFTRSKRPGVDYGVGLRIFASRLFSMRLDARHMMFFTNDAGSGVDVHHELWIGLGTSISL
ncbi:MAG: outer membrane beta-barrel domain-containing protein [Myxococcota bacterium]